MLAINLSRLGRTQPELARRIQDDAPMSIEWSASKAGPLTATIEHQGRPLQLASRYDPLAEARKLIEVVDFQVHAAIVVMGLGVGHHVLEVARQLGNNTLLIVYEPDPALLRAVLEKIDHSSWLGRPGCILADHRMDRAELLAALEGSTGLLTQGTILVTHPTTRLRFPQQVTDFGQQITDILAFARTNIATALVNASRTIRNLTSNLPYYVGGTNTNDLHNLAPGIPAVCVGAGPSLARNIHHLSNPEFRKKIILISAQTTLKPLLQRGIRPDFVTALDYHEISKRFYEGLPDLPDVTLVAEAKAHHSILDSFPGPVRIVGNAFLNRLLGPLATPYVPIRDGTTVAHLSFYLAQHLGCDPIILVGQDLGFSDGLYYCPGTAIHDVWAGELGPHNTLEMMEWQRIVRHRGHLREMRDIHDQPIFSDEQMVTYLKQFEADFAEAKQTILDATEGGLPKQHTTRTTLLQALRDHARQTAPAIPLPARQLQIPRLRSVLEHLRQRIAEVGRLRHLTQDTLTPLRQMLDLDPHDTERMDRLFNRVERNRKEVEKLNDTFSLVMDLNTIGVFRRTRADRAIAHAPNDDTTTRQRKQIQRDIENLQWLSQSCDEAQDIFKAAQTRLQEFLHPPGTPGTPIQGVA